MLQSKLNHNTIRHVIIVMSFGYRLTALNQTRLVRSLGKTRPGRMLGKSKIS